MKKLQVVRVLPAIGSDPYGKYCPPEVLVYASLYFAWYDIWMGAYWDRDQRVLYICPLPMVVLQLNIFAWRRYRQYKRPGKGG